MKKQNFIQGSLILIASAAAAKVIGAVFRIPLANMLGGTGMGYFSSAYGIFTAFYAVSVTGLPVAASAMTAESAALGQFGKMKKIKSTALKICALTGLAFTLLMLALAYPFCAFVSKSPEAALSAAAIAPSVLFGCVTAVYRGYYEGMRNMYPTAVSQIIEAAVKLLAGLALCGSVLHAAESSPEAIERAAEFIHRIFPFKTIAAMTAEEMTMPLAAAAAAAGVTVSSLAGTVYVVLRDLTAGDGIKASSADCGVPSDEIAGKFFSVMIPVALGALVTNLTSLIDLATIIRSLTGAAEKAPGYFSRFLTDGVDMKALPNFFFGSFTGLAVTVFNLIPSFTNMFGKSAIPSISEAFAEKSREKTERSTMNVIFTAAFIAVPAGIGISVLAPQILDLLFPSRSAETALCVLPLRFLGIGVIFLSVSSVLFSALQAAGRSSVPVKIMLWGVAVKLAGNLILVPVPHINITGAAVSTTLCYCLIMAIALRETAKCTFIKRSAVYLMLAKMAFCGSLCGAAAFLTDKALCSVWDTRFTLVVSVAAGVIIYIISTHLTGILTKSTLKLLIS